MRIFCCFLLISFQVLGQADTLESLQQELEKSQSLEQRVDLLNRLSHAYSQVSLPSSEQFAHDALELAIPADYQKGVATAYNNLGICYSIKGEYTSGMDYFVRSLRIREAQNDHIGVSRTLNNISRVFIYQEDFAKALEYSTRSLETLGLVDDPEAIGNARISLGSIYMNKKDYAEALKMFTAARDLFAARKLSVQQGWALLNMANVYERENKHEMALHTCFEAMKFLNLNADLFTAIELYETIGSIYTKMKNEKDAAIYLHKAIRLADERNDSNGKLSGRLKLADMFKAFNRLDSALYYKEAYLKLHDEIFDAEKSKQLATLEKVYQTEKKDRLLEVKSEQIRWQNTIISIISALLMVLAILGFIVFRYYREKKRSASALQVLNKEIYDKHEEILTQAEELSEANEEIKRINETLEQEVSLRAEKIERQNEMLIEYAYFNAHNVRGPLARILGLAQLMVNESSAGLIKEYNTYMYTSALELDHVVREINTKLSGEGDRLP